MVQISKEWLEKKYLEEGLSERRIGKLIGLDGGGVHYWLKKYGIPTRPLGGPGNHVKLTKSALEFLEGNLLGDGGIYPHSHSSATYKHGSSQLGFLQDYIMPSLSQFGIEQSGPIRSQISVYTKRPVYLYTSRAYRELLALQRRWYRPSNKKGRRFEKHVPEDLVLTPTVLLNWFIGDGSIRQSSWRTSLSGLTFFTNSFAMGEVELLCDKLCKLGLRAKLYKIKNHGKRQPTIVFTDIGTIKHFFEIIGSCPEAARPYYQYKWPDPERLVNHNPRKLSHQDVLDIRNSKLPARELARKYGVHRATIYKVKRGATGGPL